MRVSNSNLTHVFVKSLVRLSRNVVPSKHGIIKKTFTSGSETPEPYTLPQPKPQPPDRGPNFGVCCVCVGHKTKKDSLKVATQPKTPTLTMNVADHARQPAGRLGEIGGATRTSCDDLMNLCPETV